MQARLLDREAQLFIAIYEAQTWRKRAEGEAAPVLKWQIIFIGIGLGATLIGWLVMVYWVGSWMRLAIIGG